MLPVRIYTTPYCPYCSAAKQFLSKKQIQFEDFDVSRNPALRSEMSRKAGGWTTVPMIFIGERFIGGYQDMAKLDMRGELDQLLNG